MEKQFSYITSHNLRAPVTNLLALSQLHAMGGDIQVASEPNKGCTFSISFKRI